MMGKLFDMTIKGHRARTAMMPLLPASRDALPPFRIERLGEDRFRLTIAATGLTEDDIEVIDVYVEGGLLHIGQAAGEEAQPLLDCNFLLLEPLTLTRVELHEGELVVELERDHATPCVAVPPPVRRESTEALALAA